MERRLQDLRKQLVGENARRRWGHAGPISISRRLNVASLGTRFSNYGPTPTHRRSLEIAREEFAEMRDDLDRLIRRDLPSLETRLDAAGVPWTPGRPTPQPTKKE